jgi:hypothetical protein
LSNLVNEPLFQPSAAELEELKDAGKTQPADIESSDII